MLGNTVSEKWKCTTDRKIYKVFIEPVSSDEMFTVSLKLESGWMYQMSSFQFSTLDCNYEREEMPTANNLVPD